ncbi:MAG TPA: hypothetical protein VHG32_09160 [Thermoanaerobaculia bacterium]|jgi:hypothetical protein|nr:hypothetical protein [Thermoanaerobaculia bacterium]
MKTPVGRSFPVVALVLAALAAVAGSVPRALAQTQEAVPVSVSPALPADGDAILVSADVIAPVDASAGLIKVEGGQITLYVNAPILSPTPPGVLQHLEWSLAALPAGSYSLSISLPNVPTLGFAVRPRAARLDLVGGRFQVSVAALQSGASPAAVRLSDSGGYFTFFDPANIELTFKIIDGRAVNSHYWVFIASMTDTPLMVTVTDTQAPGCGSTRPCTSRTYTNPPHTNQNFIDVVAF